MKSLKPLDNASNEIAGIECDAPEQEKGEKKFGERLAEELESKREELQDALSNLDAS